MGTYGESWQLPSLSLCGPSACQDLWSLCVTLVYNDFLLKLLSFTVTAPVFFCFFSCTHKLHHTLIISHTFQVFFPTDHLCGIFHWHQSTRRSWDLCFIAVLVLYHCWGVLWDLGCCECCTGRWSSRGHILQRWSVEAASWTMPGAGQVKSRGLKEMSVSSPWSTTHSLNLD